MARRSGPRWALGLWLVLTIGMGLALGLTVGLGTLWAGLTSRRSGAIAEIYLLVAGMVWISLAGIGWVVVRRVDQLLARDWLDIVAWINQLEEGRWEPLPVPDTGPWGQLSYALNQMARRLAMAQSERERFLASVAHELKTPLTVLRANLEGLATGELPATPARWTTLLREVQRLTRLVNDLLLIETLQSSPTALHRASYRLDVQIEEIVLKFGPLADLQHISLVGTGEPVEVEADRDRIDQVLTNLVDNALRHTPQGGRMAITWRGLPEGVECCVDDSGPGIPVAQHTLVTRPFYRDPRSSGVGLGLAVAVALLQAHGGSLAIGNSPWGGARVCLRLPGRTD